METFVAKAALRSKVKIALKAIKCSEKSAQSVEVTKQVLTHPYYQSSKGISVFISMPDEIDTSVIIQNIFTSGKHCYIPRLII